MMPTVTYLEVLADKYVSPDHRARMQTLQGYCQAGMKIRKS